MMTPRVGMTLRMVQQRSSLARPAEGEEGK